MATIPKALQGKLALSDEVKLVRMGKVRNTYSLDAFPEFFLPYATDRISIFDFVLNAQVPQKGEVLNALNIFWTTEVLKTVCEHDIVAFGSGIDAILPEKLRNYEDIQKRATVIEKLEMLPKEDIVRIYLTGSAMKPYKADGIVCGHRLPNGLIDGSKLPFPIYTPSTKEEVGHDEHITADSVTEKFGHKHERLALQVAQAISAYAETRGIILADTKFEISKLLKLADEKGTPDSSRFWEKQAYLTAIAKGKLPPSLDKQYVRDWGKEEPRQIHKLNPANPTDIAKVHAMEVPFEILKKTSQIYRYIFWRLTGKKLELFQKEKMGISVDLPRLNVTVLLGSRSDKSQIQSGLESINPICNLNVHILSCHRNSDELLNFADSDAARKTDVFVAGAGKAAQLPGMFKSYLCASKHGIGEKPVIGIAFESSGKNDKEAAIFSIENLPGQPVDLDPDGHAYFGPTGATEACQSAVFHEFFPKTIEKKPAEYNIEI